MKRQRHSSSARPYKKFKASQAPPPSPARKRRSTSVALASELKYLDTGFATDATTTPTFVDLCSLATGDTASDRDGNKIIMKSFDLRMVLSNEALTQSNVVRVLLVHSLQPNTALPTQAGAGADTDVLANSSFTSPRNIASASLYRILMDEVFVLNAQSGTGGAPSRCYFRKYIKLPEVVTTYKDATPASFPQTNGYSLLYFSDTAAGATDVNVEGSVRIRFEG